MRVPAARAGPLTRSGQAIPRSRVSGKANRRRKRGGWGQIEVSRPGKLRVLGKGSREVTGHEVGARPDLSYVGAVAQPSGLGQLLEGIVISPVANCPPGRGKMIIAPRLDGRDQCQIRPTATAARPGRVLGSANRTGQ